MAGATAECGSTYTDAGATASDNCATGLVVTRSGDTVNTSVLGAVYTATYNANDGNGITATSGQIYGAIALMTASASTLCRVRVTDPIKM